METNTQTQIKDQVTSIINNILKYGSDINIDDLTVQDKLNIIISESSQALELLTTIEDEFDIELDDDDVDLDFFTNIDVMIVKIAQTLTS